MRPNFRIEFINTTNPVPHEVAWYKWEFLRRNPEYRADYRKFVARFGAWFKEKGYWWDEERREDTWTKADEEYFYNKIAPVIAAICEKWQVGNLYPPEWRFSRKSGMRKVGRADKFPPTAIAPELNWDFRLMSDLTHMGFTGTADSARRYRNLLLIEFDLNRPMKDLTKYVKNVLVRAVENYRDELKELGLKKPSARRRLQDYDSYLIIWDLRRQGASFAEIAKRCFPGLSEESAFTRVRDHLNAAKRLILGHYKEIS